MRRKVAVLVVAGALLTTGAGAAYAATPAPLPPTTRTSPTAVDQRRLTEKEMRAQALKRRAQAARPAVAVPGTARFTG